MIYCCFDALTVNLIFPSSIWRMSLAASKLRSGLLSSVIEISPLRSSFSMYWPHTHTQTHSKWKDVSFTSTGFLENNFNQNHWNLSHALTHIPAITYITVFFLIEEEQCISTEACPQFTRGLHTHKKTPELNTPTVWNKKLWNQLSFNTFYIIRYLQIAGSSTFLNTFILFSDKMQSVMITALWKIIRGMFEVCF